MKLVLFYILSAVILIFSLLNVTSRRILRAAIYLLFVLVAIGGLFFLFQFHFLAAVQLTIYAGGVMVLIIFSILLTGQINDKLEFPSLKRSLVAAITVCIGAILCIITFLQYEFTPSHSIADGTIKTIGTQLLSYGENGYVLPFEVISILLLAAMIAAIVIAKKGNDIINSQEENRGQ